MTFIFKSEDSEDGKEREDRFIRELMIYAARKFKGNCMQAARFLGMTPKGFSGRRKRYPELEEVIQKERGKIEKDHGKMSIFFKDELWEKKE